MKTMNRFQGLLASLALSFALLSCAYAEYSYELIKRDQHVLHVVTLKPQSFDIRLAKANNQLFGRDTLQHIAETEQATLAINGGFFEMGGPHDGKPSGSFVVQGLIYALSQKHHDYLIANPSNQWRILNTKLSLSFKIHNKTIQPSIVNQLIQFEPHIALYTQAWGPTTLSRLDTRQEILLDNQGVVLEHIQHGNNPIPNKGMVLSFPRSAQIPQLAKGDKIKIEWGQYKLNDGYSVIMGIPMLIEGGKVTQKVLKSTSKFASQPHARTAIGIKANGDWVLLIAEHLFQSSFKNVTLADIHKVLQHARLDKASLQSELSVAGLSLKELANELKAQGCVQAINLDGGGSSTLYIKGKIVNHVMGDADGDAGLSVTRALSDALIFTEKSSA